MSPHHANKHSHHFTLGLSRNCISPRESTCEVSLKFRGDATYSKKEWKEGQITVKKKLREDKRKPWNKSMNLSMRRRWKRHLNGKLSTRITRFTLGAIAPLNNHLQYIIIIILREKGNKWRGSEGAVVSHQPPNDQPPSRPIWKS